MIQSGENLTFTPEPLLQRLGEQGGADYFDRNALAEGAVDSRRFVHRPHAAAPDLPDDFVGTDARCDEIRAGVLASIRRMEIRNRLLHKSSGALMGGKQEIDFRYQGWVRRAKPGQYAAAILRRKVHHRFKNRANLL